MAAQTIQEVIDQLQDIIDQSKENESPLGYFAALYQKVTITIKNKLGTNYFDDDERMEKLDVVFANRYIDAYNAYQNNLKPTQSWIKAFQESKNKKLIVLQHLMLGMNAHINLDLGIAAAAITTQDTIGALEDDFNKINEVLGGLVDNVQNDLIEINPILFWILKSFKKVDDLLIDFSMNIARDGAWKFANELSNSNSKENLILERDNKIAALTKLIIHQPLLINIVFRLLRWNEKGSVSEKIEKLVT